MSMMHCMKWFSGIMQHENGIAREKLLPAHLTKVKCFITLHNCFIFSWPNKGQCINNLYIYKGQIKGPKIIIILKLMQLKPLKRGQPLNNEQIVQFYITPKVSFVEKFYCIYM